MKSKVFKIGTVLLVCVCLVSFISLPVSADYGICFSVPISKPDAIENGGYIEVLCEDANGNYFVEVIIVSSFATVSYDEPVNDIRTLVVFNEHSIVLKPFSDYTSDTVTLRTSCYIVSNNGTVYNYSSGNPFTIDYGSTILSARVYGDLIIQSVNVDTFSDESFVISYGSDSLSISLLNTIISLLKNDDTADKINENADKNADEIKDNQDKNTQAQIDADKENTEQITNGWQGADGVDDGTTDDLKNAESAALGGKSDEQIENEINNALTFDIWSFGGRNITLIKQLFTNVYNVLGSNYQSLFLLSLTLGLAAFLIGRRYG